MGSKARNSGVDASPDRLAGRTPEEIATDLAIPQLTNLSLLTAGRSASVFRAYQVATRRPVAVKVLHDELSSDTGQRFDRERAITGQLSGHTGIVPLFETGSTADGEPYLVMPYYQRGSFAELMSRYGPLPWREAAFLLEPVAVTMAEVHGRGLVHRNLKPENILLTDFLLPRVADFGMCLPIGQASTEATLVVGEVAPPEVMEHGDAHPASDVFGLSSTLWALLRGRLPTTGPGSDRRVRPQHVDLTGEIGLGRQIDTVHDAGLDARFASRPALDTPEPLLALIRRSIAIDPEMRIANAAEFVGELRRAVADAGRSERSPRGPRSAPPAPNVSVGEPDAALRPDHVFPPPRAEGAPTEDGPAADSVAGGTDRRSTDRADSTTAATRTADHAADERFPSATGHPLELYLLALVALITIVIVVMVGAAVLAVQ